LHAEAWRLIDSSSWARTFEASDAGATGQPLEWLSPYFDVRVIEFLFSLPPMPHFANKDIVRQSMRGWIPDELLRRPKTHLPTDPSAIRFRQASRQWAGKVGASAEVRPFIDGRILRQSILKADQSQYASSQQAFAISLAIWLSERNR